MQGFIQQLYYNTSTKIFHERNDLVLFILNITHGGYNINIRCNQKFMFCKDRDIDFSVWLCREYARDMCAQHFWGIPFHYPSLFGDFHFTDRHFLGFPLYHPVDCKRTLSNALTAIKNKLLLQM